MPLLAASDLAKSFGPVDIFSGINLAIPRGARIAIVGPNGIGKTTLLRILVDMDEPSAGVVSRARELSLGYLPQEAGLAGTHTLWEECLDAFESLREMETELAYIESMLSEASEELLLDRYGRLQHEFEHLGGYTYETRIRQTLTGLGFEPSDFNRPLPQLSGGQRTRAVLARLLLSDPDLLILDEPTNHLDIQAVEWLEGYLSQWHGATLIVSHDRYFLDKVVDHIWEMSRRGMQVYRGNYTAYIQQRQARWERSQEVFQSEKERLLKEMDYIKRNISGQNTLQAKGKLRRLSREVEAIQSLGFDAVQGKNWLEISAQADISTHTLSPAEVERRIKSLSPPSHRPPRLHINLKSGYRSGDLVLRTRNLAIGYEDEGKPLFHAPDLLLRRGECAAIIGPNGAGKTTFLKTLLERLPPLEGEVVLGASLKIGYFAQAHEDLNPANTLVEEIDLVSPNMLLGEVRDYLARFLFTGEDVFKQVTTLSGGERGRLALAKLALSDANLLLLDEPTNHLDIPSQEILQEVLQDYEGTIMLVSHDRYLIDALGSQIWEILPDESVLQVFLGTYSEYKAYQQVQVDEAEAHTRQVAMAARYGSGRAGAGSSKTAIDPEARKRKARLREVEGLVATLEATLHELGLRLETPPADPARVQKLGEEYVRVQQELDRLMEEWGELS
jgi:ATP-binding cassette subfamily F protein 3